MAVQLYGRNTLFVLGDQVNSLVPPRKRLCSVEDSTSGYRGLPPAMIALKNPAMGHLATLITTAVGAGEAIWPPPLGERIEALLLAVLLREFAQTDVFLKLYLVTSYGGFP